MTIFYRALARIEADTPAEQALSMLAPAFYAEPTPAAREAFAAGWATGRRALRPRPNPAQTG